MKTSNVRTPDKHNLQLSNHLPDLPVDLLLDWQVVGGLWTILRTAGDRAKDIADAAKDVYGLDLTAREIEEWVLLTREMVEYGASLEKMTAAKLGEKILFSLEMFVTMIGHFKKTHPGDDSMAKSRWIARRLPSAYMLTIPTE